jgi:hypothetical protein
MAVKRYNGSDWDTVAGQGAQGATGASGTAPLTTKGDLLGYDTAATRVPVGTNGQVLTAASTTSTGLQWATPSSGAVVQVKSAVYSTATSNATTTYADTGLTLSITPTSASNKILVFIQQYQKNTNTAAAWETAAFLRLMRDSTAIYRDGVFAWYAKQGDESGDFRFNTTLVYLDSPATTSSVTYKTQQKMYATTITAQADSTPSTITLMEVTP